MSFLTTKNVVDITTELEGSIRNSMVDSMIVEYGRSRFDFKDRRTE